MILLLFVVTLKKYYFIILFNWHLLYADKEFKAPTKVNYRRNSLWYLPKKMEGDDWNMGKKIYGLY